MGNILRRILQGLAAVAFISVVLFHPAVRAQDSTRIGLKMFHGESGKHLYEAERTIESADGRVTERTVFRKASGEAIQQSETVYDDASLKLISHQMKDSRLGLEEEVTVSEGKIKFVYREAGDEEVEKDEEDWADNMIIAPTIMPLLRRNWDKLVAGEEVVFELVVASRQGTITFRLRKEAQAGVHGEPATVVVMEPDSFLIRALVNPMFYTVADAAPHRLLRYAGRTTVKADDGGDQDLRVEYSY